MKRFLLSLISIATLIAGVAAAEEKKPAEPQDISKLVENIEVRVVNVDVVVTDKNGRPVQGLTKDDFELYDNGRPQQISNFYEVASRTVTDKSAAKASGAAAAPVATEVPRSLQRRFIFFIDNLSLSPFNRKPVFAEMKKFVDDQLQQGDLAMIATFNHDLKVRVPFTNDHAYIKQTLDIIAEENSFGLQNLSERKGIEDQIKDARSYEDAVAAARTYAYSVENDLRQAVNSLKSLMTTLAGVEGKKIMVITSEGLPIQPGRELFYYIDDIALEKKWRSSSSVYLEATNFDAKAQIEAIAQAANANGVTLYTLHAGGLGVQASTGSAENQGPTSPVVANAALTNSTDSLKLLAYMTGGISTTGTNNFSSAFGRIAADINSYYSLGYRSGAERVDRQRAIEVRAKNKSYTVRSRKTFVEKSLYTEISDRVLANVFYRADQNDLGITVTTGQAKSQGNDQYLVPIEIHIPMNNLAFIPTDTAMRGGFSVFVVNADDKGDTSDVQQKTQSLSLKQSELDDMKGKSFTYSLDLLMNKGRNRISVGVLDEASKQAGYATQEVLASDLR